MNIALAIVAFLIAVVFLWRGRIAGTLLLLSYAVYILLHIVAR